MTVARLIREVQDPAARAALIALVTAVEDQAERRQPNMHSAGLDFRHNAVLGAAFEPKPVESPIQDGDAMLLPESESNIPDGTIQAQLLYWDEDTDHEWKLLDPLTASGVTYVLTLKDSVFTWVEKKPFVCP